jgi:hypothetical protein
MNRRVVSLFLVLAFVIGCGASIVAQSFIVPPAKAEGVQRWEYFCFAPQGMTVGKGVQDTMQKANKAGLEGWEMVNIGGAAYFMVCMKRPLP